MFWNNLSKEKVTGEMTQADLLMLTAAVGSISPAEIAEELHDLYGCAFDIPEDKIGIALYDSLKDAVTKEIGFLPILED